VGYEAYKVMSREDRKFREDYAQRSPGA